MKNLDVEVEGGELLLQSDNGSYAIIPKRERNRVLYYLKSGKQDKLNNLISKLPTEKDYAKNGTLLPPFKNKQVNSFENNVLSTFNMSGKEPVVNKPTKAKNPNAKYEPISHAKDYNINYKNVDDVIDKAKKREPVTLNDGIEYISDYGKDSKGDYISFYRKDGNKLNDLLGTSTEYYDRKYIDRSKFENSKFNDRLTNLTSESYNRFLENLDKSVDYDYSNSLNLTQGRYNTGKLPKELVDEMYDIAKKENIDVYDLLSVAGRESTFGVGKNGDLARLEVVSGWNLSQKYIPKTLEGFLADKQLPFITTRKKSSGYEYDINDKSKYWNYLKSNPNVLDEYEKYLATVPKPDYGEYNSYRELARMIKDNQMNKYNPGDKDYQNKLLNEKKLLLQEKELTEYLKSKTNAK